MLNKLFRLIVFGGTFATAFAVELYNSSFELGGSGFSLNRYSGTWQYRSPEFDRSEFADGRLSLKVENPDADMLVLNSSEFLLEKGKNYTLSWYVKAGRDIAAFRAGIYSTTSAEEKGLWITSVGTVRVKAGAWQRCSVTLKAENDRPYHLDFRWGNVNGQPAPGTVWMDAIQIDEGDKALPYRSRKEISGALKLPKRVFPAERIQGEVHLLHPGLKAEKGTLLLKLSDTVFPDRAPEIFRKELTLKPGRNPVPFLFEPKRFGHYRVDAEVIVNGKKIFLPAAYLARTYPVSGRIPALGTEVQLGIDFGHGAVNPNQSCMKLAYRGQEAAVEEYYRFYADSGVKLLRSGNSNSFAWADLETAPGVFDWRFMDLWMENSFRHKMAVMPVLGNMFYLRDGAKPRSLTKIPLHVMKKSRIVANPVNCGAWDGVEPDMNSWKNYVDAVTKRYKGLIQAYEITNEPNICITGKAYSAYLIPAADIIRRNSPGALVIGGGVTTDYNGKSEQFLREMTESGAIQRCDALSFHPYSSPQENSKNSAVEALAVLREKTEKVKPGFPVWCTELYYLRADSGFNGNLQNKRIQPSDLIRRFLLDLGEGVRQCVYLNESGLIQQELLPGWEGTHSIATVQLIPNAVYMAHNAAAHLFSGARPVGKFNWGEGISCYLYHDRNGQEIAAFWHYGKKPGTVVLKGKNLRLFDLFGNQLEFSGPVPVTERPNFLRGGNLREVLKQAVIQ